MSERGLGPSGDPGHYEVDDTWWQPPEMPADPASLGLTRNTEEGAWIEFASMLRPDRPAHLAVAWLLLAVFLVPLLLGVWHLVTG